MKTAKDARRVVELSDQRDALNKLAGSIRTAESVAVCDPDGPRNHLGYRISREPGERLTFEHLADELRDLVKREAAAQIAAIDDELKALGVTPDEFDAAEADRRDQAEDTAVRVAARQP
jgi:hypothetical protein